MSLPRYGEYKDSGAEWLGSVPDHWSVGRLKSQVSLVTVKATQRLRPIALENIEGWSGRFIPTEGGFEGEGIAFVAGDLLFGKLRPYLAKAYLANGSGEAVGDFHVLRPRGTMNARFLQYQILSKAFIDVIDGSTFGSKMPRASWESLGNMPLALPSAHEQAAIATFLDRETAKIDALIAEQEKLIALLAEKRQATISHAVTRGLDPNAPMKDSGLAWLGEVPAHWEVKRLRYVASAVQTGGTPTSEAPAEDAEEGFDWYTPGDFDSGAVLGNARKRVSTSVAISGETKIFPAGSVLVVSIGATLGKVGLTDRPASANQQLNAVVFPEGCNGRYFAYSLSVKVEMMRFLSNASTIGIMNQERTKEIAVAVPPAAEQSQIAEFIDHEANRLALLQSDALRAVTLLKERRSALIAAAVTGQIDVSGAVEARAT